MEKQQRLFYYLLVLVCLSNIGLYGHTLSETKVLVVSSDVFATPIPTGIYDRYYCLNDTPVALTATFIAGASENWYTTKMGGTATSTRPTPATSVKGATAYYVSQTVGGEESGRAEIIVNVDKQFALFCAGRTTNSVFFDFANVGQSRFDYNYTIDGGVPIIGTQTAPSSLTVSGLSEGQTVVLTVTAFGTKSCVLNPTLSDSCKTLCTATTTPDFAQILPICSGDAAPVLEDTSPNGITGTWSPSTIDNNTGGSYVFTPDPVAFPCANKQTMAITVGAFKEPGFEDLTICYDRSPPILQNTSPNGITGTWSPNVIDNRNNGSYLFTPDSDPCALPKTINVFVKPVDTLVDFQWTVTQAFSDNQMITITAEAGDIDYLYQLDDGPFQESPVFENVSSGYHTVTVIDKYGCSDPITKSNILVIGYPKFFTPNGDDYNDRWNIFTLQDDLASKIHIFDRYGKLLKEIRPGGTGWDGTYNGREMPGNDYWFVVEYQEDGVFKKYKSHFSLKR